LPFTSIDRSACSQRAPRRRANMGVSVEGGRRSVMIGIDGPDAVVLR